MKQLIPFLFILFLLPTLLSIELDVKSQYNSGETLIAKISGNFLEKISSDDISFYRKHVQIPMDFEIEKIDNNYYLYAILPQPQELTNYSIKIQTKFMNSTEVVEQELKKEFIISEQKADFNIIPGFIKTENDFSLTLQNLKQIPVEIKIDEESEKGFFSSLFGSDEENSVTLNSEESKKIYFEIDDFDESLSTIKLNSNNTEYEVLVFVSSLPEKGGDWVEPEDDITLSPEIKQEAEEKKVDVQDLKNCKDLGGTICGSGTECDIPEKKEYDALCCYGNCVEKKITSWKFLGWGIIILVIIILVVFFTKYKGAKKEFNLLDIARGK